MAVALDIAHMARRVAEALTIAADAWSAYGSLLQAQADCDPLAAASVQPPSPPQPAAPVLTEAAGVSRPSVLDVSSQTPPAAGPLPPPVFLDRASWRTPARMKILERDWPAGVPVDEVRARMEALPGAPPPAENKHIATAAFRRGLKRPAKFPGARRGPEPVFLPVESLVADGNPGDAQDELDAWGIDQTGTPVLTPPPQGAAKPRWIPTVPHGCHPVGCRQDRPARSDRDHDADDRRGNAGMGPRQQGPAAGWRRAGGRHDRLQPVPGARENPRPVPIGWFHAAVCPVAGRHRGRA